MDTDCIRLHSAYDPVREAERFAATTVREGDPRCIVISEPGDSYLAPVFRRLFPDAILLALRYTTDRFLDTDSLWNAVWRPTSRETVIDFLYRFIPEEYLPQTVFLSWKPADSIWPDTAKKVWLGIADLVRLQSGIINTRTHFGKRWLANMVNSVVFARYPSRITVMDGQVLLACSGPSLETIFPLNRKSCQIASVSSALATLTGNGIMPDICITTDGGYWAREHLRYCPSRTIVAFPPEAAIPGKILETNPVVFLSFSSAIEQKLFLLAGIRPVHAERNGTVAGTAVRYLLDQGTGPVIAAGLDLSSSTSFTHARPHAFDPVLEGTTGRFSPLCGVLYGRSENTFALDAYARWFSAHGQTFNGRFYRIPASLRVLPEIPVKDIDVVSGKERIPVQFVRQQVPEPGLRAVRVAKYLDERADAISRYTPGTEQEPDIVEFLQLTSFSRYLASLKSGDFGDLRTDTANYLRHLAERTRNRGQ